jgi:hypothetical protein
LAERAKVVRNWTGGGDSNGQHSLQGKCKVDYLIFSYGFGELAELRPIPKSEDLVESSRYTNTVKEDPVYHLLKAIDLVGQLECYTFKLGDGRETVKLMKDLVGMKKSY